MAIIDMQGRVFGYLEVKDRAPSPPGPNERAAWWWALCTACGTTRPYQGGSLRKGCAKSCGCRRAEFVSKANVVWPPRHGPEYDAWKNMRHRCSRPSHPHYHQYGGRGIRVCAEWDADFAVFFRDMGRRPSPKHTLERQDNERGYEPDNVCWATFAVQANNRRGNVRLTFEGRTMTVSQWARELGLAVSTMHNRVKSGWTMQRIVTTPTAIRSSRKKGPA